MTRASRLAGLVLLVVLAVDQGTKAVVREALEYGERRDAVWFVDLVHVRNEGVAFGAFSGGGAIVVVLVVAALTALLVYFSRNATVPLVWLPTGMLLGGAVGNVIDRLREGHVTDFLKVPHWPAFNVADVCITVGVVVLLWVVERGARDGAAGRPR